MAIWWSKNVNVNENFMSNTGSAVARSPEPEAHDKVLDNNPDRIGIWKCWFLRRGENQSTRRKTSRSKEENQQQTQPTYDAGSGNRTRDTLVEGERSHHCTIPAPSLHVTKLLCLTSFKCMLFTSFAFCSGVSNFHSGLQIASLERRQDAHIL